jgi:DNA-binding winged helix-turn-helix (wHTH) protein/Tfp pilus assembly protein PilF
VAGFDSGSARVFRFADLELDPCTLELRRAGGKVRLEGQPLRVLALLLERPGELVSRDELRKQLWPANTVVDFDHSINYAVKRLREALGDSADAPRFIETLPRRGYRFIHPVEPAAAHRPLRPRGGRHGVWQAGAFGLAGFLFVLLGGSASGWHDRAGPAEQPRHFHPAAQEAYMLGRAYFLKTPSMGALKARDYYRKAIAIDPTYAAPYAGLAELYAMVGWRFAKDPRSGYEDVRLATRQLAEKALVLDESRAEAYAVLAWNAQQEYDWAAAERWYRHAIELNPRYGMGRIWYAMFLYGMERFDEAALQARRAQELEPASPMVNTWAGRAYFFTGRLDDAMAAWQLALELDPKYAHCYLALVGSYIARGMPDRVIQTLEKALADIPNEAHLVGALAQAYASAGRRAEAVRLLRSLQLREASDEVLPEFPLIWAHAALGDHDEAFARLEKAYREHRDRMMWVKVDPQLASLRTDPRFHDLVRRMNMTPLRIATSSR